MSDPEIPVTEIPARVLPGPDEIKAARLAAKLTQKEAAELVWLENHARWSEYERGVRRPEWARWQIFLLLTDQHPKARLVARRV